LRNIKVPVVSNKNQPKKHAPKITEQKKETPTKEVEKTQPIFNLESEISKIRIVVPFGEIIRVT